MHQRLDLLLGYLVATYLVVQFGTTTLHMYHVCLENDILSDYKPEPGLKIPGYVQLLFIDGRTDDVQTLVTSAHQVCESFYKTIVLEGSEIRHFISVLSKTRRVYHVNGLTIDKLAKRVRPQFRKLHENIIFFEREILAFVFYYKRTYENSYGTDIGIKREFKIYDEFLRQRRKFAYELKRQAQDFRDKARQMDNDASSLLFCIAYSIIGLGSVFAKGRLRYFLLCAVIFVIVYGSFCTTDFWRQAAEFRVKADRKDAEFHDLLKEVRTYQDYVFKSRNVTLSNFQKAVGDKYVKETFIILRIFTEVMKSLQWIDIKLQGLASLAKTLEMNRDLIEKADMLEQKSRPIMDELRSTLENITGNIDRIFHILK